MAELDQNPESQDQDTDEPFQIDPEEWGEVKETMEMLREAMTSYQPEATQSQSQQEDGQLKMPDVYSENYPEELQQYIDKRIEQAVTPFAEHTESEAMSEAEERAMDIIDSLASEKGDLPEGGKQIVRTLANEFIGETQDQYGFGPQAAEAALAKAYDHALGIFEQANKSYYESQMNHMATLGQAKREPGAETPAAQGLERTKGDELSLVRSFFPPNQQ